MADRTKAIPGDDTGIPVPLTPQALLAAGAGFLTAALRAFGALGPHDAVAEITEFRPVTGGSTGRKAALTVRYAEPDPGLPTHLFAKFSRDLDDPARDLGRTQMAAEVRLAALSRTPGFPITVPRSLFADYHGDSGTGLLLTERIGFGRDGIEPQHHKCRDYELTDATAHYRALVTALARLAGWQRSPAAPPEATADFPVDLASATVGQRPPLRADRIEHQLRRLAEFAADYPGLLPEQVREPEFLSGLADWLPRVAETEPVVWQRLSADPDYIALCHWNANIDNAWFWCEPTGALSCGLLDWGCVGRMNVAMALWGSLSAAETSLWDSGITDLVGVFVDEYAAAGGPGLDPEELIRQLLRYATVMGVSWLLGAPGRLRAGLGDPTPELTRFHPTIAGDESLRAPLQMLVNVLWLWRTRDIAVLLPRP